MIKKENTQEVCVIFLSNNFELKILNEFKYNEENIKENDKTIEEIELLSLHVTYIVYGPNSDNPCFYEKS